MDLCCPRHGINVVLTELCYQNQFSPISEQRAFWKCDECKKSGIVELKKIYDLIYNASNERANTFDTVDTISKR